ncbi:MAG: STAS domain-containing protein [Terriglobia bacterium]|jgi:rsbT antagonist protein RsbS
MTNQNISLVKVRNTLLVTMPADPDDVTVTTLQEEVLGAMEEYRPKGLVLDISAVETLDSFFARTITETSRMVTMMGGQTVIAGMRPSVAITATQLGLTMVGTFTALTVDRALDLLTHLHPRRRIR